MSFNDPGQVSGHVPLLTFQYHVDDKQSINQLSRRSITAISKHSSEIRKSINFSKSFVKVKCLFSYKKETTITIFRENTLTYKVLLQNYSRCFFRAIGSQAKTCDLKTPVSFR